MNEMTEIEILARKIELREQHLLLILLDLEAKRKHLIILNDREESNKGHKGNGSLAR